MKARMAGIIQARIRVITRGVSVDRMGSDCRG